jgi:hypothetical protein
MKPDVYKRKYCTYLKKMMCAGWFMVLLVLVNNPKVYAQNMPQSLSDIKRMWDQKKPRLDGSVDISQIFYGATGTEALRQPYSYLISGDFTFSMFNLAIPVAFSFTNQSADFQGTLPSFDLNQFGISPTYKSVTLYAGHNSMFFSPYTMNGHIFLGAGVEVRPKGRWSVSALYGRFQKNVALDTLNSDVLPAYHRMGYGTKVRYHFKRRKPEYKQMPEITSKYDKNGDEIVRKPAPPVAPPKSTFNESEDYIEMIYFGATDNANSLPTLPDSLGVKPEENAVLSARLNKRFGKHWVFESEVASSALTRDKRIETKDPSQDNLFVITDPIFTRRTSTAYYNAYKANLNFNAQRFTAGVGYERIDPGYRTLGAYYFNNDLENITVNFSTRLFKNKLSVTTNVGTQRNNLDDDQLNTLRRGVGSINVNVMPHPKLNINVAYSGFQSFSQIRTRFDQLNQLTPLDRYRDSLKFTQISQNASLNINYELARSRNSQQYLNINGSYQIADNQQSVGNIQSDISRFYNSNVSYSLSIRPLGFNAVVAFDFNQNVAQNLSNRILGPTLMLKKLMLEQKLQSSLTLSQNNSYTDGRLSDSIFNIRWSNGYNVARQHMLSLNAIWLTRTRYEQTTQAAQKASEFTLTFKYTFIL